MTEPPIPPLDEDLESLLAAERHAQPPAEAIARVRSRLGPVGAGPDTEGPGHGAGHGWLASHAAGMAATAFVVGGVVGASLYASVQRPAPPRVAYVDRPAAPAPTPWVEHAPAEAVPTAPPPADAPLPAPRTAASAPAPESLGAERAVLDRARSALTGGDAAGALALLEDHARQFKRPQLGEEREALAIQALVALGRHEEARARAARFHEATPRSLFIPVVEAAIGAIP